MNLDEFTRIARQTDWLEESVGFSMDVDAAADWPPRSFRITSDPAKFPETMPLDLEWLGVGDALRDVEADFFRFYGRFAEEAQFINRKIEGSNIVYEVILGTRRHGHRAAFRIGGPNVARVIASYERVRSEIRGTER
jgi:hypothetical protein